jgi:hypothetical protein
MNKSIRASTPRGFVKIAAVIMLASLTMANKECEKKPDPRSLKKNVKIIGMDASTFMNSSQFNFAEQAQERVSAAIFSNGDFYERNFYPKAEDYQDEVKFNAVQATSFNSKMTVSKKISLKTWFPKLNASKSLSEASFDPESSCLIERPQHYLDGKILSLEAHSGGGLVFGFNESMVQLPLQASFNLDRMKMDMVMNTYDSWTQEKTQSQIASVLKKDLSLKIGLDLGIIHIGPQIYRKTGLAEVTDQVLKKALEQTASALKAQPSQQWQSRVVINNDNYIGILGGDELGIKVGDQFIVENENHSWLGRPCADGSIITASIATTIKPWIVEVDRIGTGLSRAKVLNENENESIRVGASVRIYKLVEEVPVPAEKK